MKKLTSLALAVAFAVVMATPVFAADLSKSFDKFVGGTIDVLHSPVELITHPVDGAKDGHIMGFTKGLIKAPFYMLKKGGHGIVDMVTFPIE
jgi:hypothetical protein